METVVERALKQMYIKQMIKFLSKLFKKKTTKQLDSPNRAYVEQILLDMSVLPLSKWKFNQSVSNGIVWHWMHPTKKYIITTNGAYTIASHLSLTKEEGSTILKAILAENKREVAIHAKRVYFQS